MVVPAARSAEKPLCCLESSWRLWGLSSPCCPQSWALREIIPQGWVSSGSTLVDLFPSKAARLSPAWGHSGEGV